MARQTDIRIRRSAVAGAIPLPANLNLGELALNTADGKMYMKTSVGGTDAVVEIGADAGAIYSSFEMFEYTATANQTTFSGADANSNTLDYNAGSGTNLAQVQVYLNGILLDYGTDFTATNGSSVVFVSGVDVGDLIQIAAYKSNVTVTADLDLADNQKLLLGDSDDLEIYHSGTHSYIKDTGTGNLNILASSSINLLNGDSSDYMARFNDNGSNQFFYDGDNKLATTSTGIQVTGNGVFSGAVTAVTGEFAGTLRVTETGTAQNFLMGNQDSGGTNKPARIQGVNGYLRFGHGSSWSGEGGTFTEKLVVGDNTNIASGALQIGGTTVIDSGRNFTAAQSVKVNAVASSNSSPAADDVELSGYGLIGNRPNLYITNANATGQIVLGISGAHNANAKLTVTTSGVTVAGTISSGAITSTGVSSFGNGTTVGSVELDGAAVGVQEAGITFQPNSAYRCIHPASMTSTAHTSDISLGWSNNKWKDIYLAGFVKADSGYQVGTTTVIDSNRNLTNIGTISSSTISADNFITTGYLRGPASFIIDPAAHGNDSGTVVIAGNLQVDGTTTTINSTTISIDDLNITLAADAANSAAANGAGIQVAGASANISYANTTDSWNINKRTKIQGPSVGATSGNTATLLSVDGGRGHIDFKEFRTAAETDWNSTTYKLQHRIDTTPMGSIDFVVDAAYGRHIDIVTQGFNSRFTASGRLGIGTTTPAAALEVLGNIVLRQSASNSETVYITSNARGGGTADADLRLGNSVNGDILTIHNENIGIGTISPDAKLRIDQNVGTVGLKVTGGSGGVNIAEFNRDVGGTTSVTISGESARPQMKFSSAGNSFAIGVNSNTFEIADNSVLGTNTRFSITNAGDVGIGTTTPDRQLEVEGQGVIRLNATGSSTDPGLDFNTSSANAMQIRYRGATDKLAIYSYGTSSDVLTIQKADGNVGIGTTTPTNKLHTYSSANEGILMEGTGGGHWFNFKSGVSNLWSMGAQAGLMGWYNRSTSYYAMVIKDAGNVGIGTISPGQKLHVNNGNIRVEKNATGLGSFISVGNTNEGTGNTSAYFFGNTASDTTYMKGGIIYETLATTNGRGDMHFVQNSVANSANATVSDSAMTILNSGNVGIGTASPQAELHIKKQSAGTTHIDQYVSAIIEDTEARLQIISDDGGNNASSILLSNETKHWGILHKGPSSSNRFSIGYAATTSSGTDIVNTFSEKFNITPAGNVGIGTTAPKAKLQVEQYGIDTTTTSSTAVTQIAIHTFPIADFRSAKYTIQVTNSTDSTYHITEMLMIHNGTTPSITEYGTVYTGSAAEATFTADISGTNLRLLATPATTDGMTFKVVCHSITV